MGFAYDFNDLCSLNLKTVGKSTQKAAICKENMWFSLQIACK